MLLTFLFALDVVRVGAILAKTARAGVAKAKANEALRSNAYGATRATQRDSDHPSADIFCKFAFRIMMKFHTYLV